MFSVMPKLYCLTCHQIPGRREAAAARFTEQGLQVEFFDGVHGATAALLPGLPAFDSPTYRITPGRLGMIMSRLLLWTQCLERPEDPVLLLEDDAVPCLDFAQELQLSLAALPADWDVVHVGSCCTEGKPTTTINERVAEVKYPLCCHAVLWRKRAIRVALEQLRRCSWSSHSDIILARLVYPRLRHYTLQPGLVTQGEALSASGPPLTWDRIQGWSDINLRGLYDEAIARVSGPAVFVEVGSWRGQSTAYLAEHLKWRLLPVEFWAVDTWTGSPGEEYQQRVVAEAGGDLYPEWQRNMAACGVSDWVRPLRMPSVEAAHHFTPGSVDFCFIDGDHSYAGCQADIQAWLPKLKPGGVMAGHDVDREGVRRAVSEHFGTRWRQWERCWIVDAPLPAPRNLLPAAPPR